MKAPVRLSRFSARLHRTLGNLFSVLVLCWFISGLVMVFWGYPFVSAAERLALVPPLQASDLAGLQPERLAGPVRDGQVVRMYHGPDGLVIIRPDGYVDKRGAALTKSSPERCLAFLHEAAPELKTRFKETVSTIGQWTVPEHVRSRLPLYLYETAAGERHYLDPVGCVLAQHSTAPERAWAYLGAIPHWLYVAPLRRFRETWRWLIIALSAAGLLVCGTGLYRGLSILRRNPGRKLPTSPIRRPVLRLHHLAGLGFGLLTSTWLLSGAMSLSPFDLAPKQPTQVQARTRFMLGDGLMPLRVAPLLAYHACRAALPEVGLLEVTAVAGVPHYLCHEKGGQTRLVDGTEPSAITARARLTAELLSQATALVIPGRKFNPEVVQEADAYYYPDHHHPVFERPYFRAAFDDSARTTLYVSPTTGVVLRHMTSNQRLERWLYHGLHSLDFPWLVRHPQLWHFIIIALLAGGIVLTTAAVALTRFPFRRPRARTGGRS